MELMEDQRIEPLKWAQVFPDTWVTPPNPSAAQPFPAYAVMMLGPACFTLRRCTSWTDGEPIGETYKMLDEAQQVAEADMRVSKS